MNEQFNNAVIARQSGTFGTFVVVEGTVKKNNNILLTFFGDKTVLIPTNARASFTIPVEHAAFDGLLFALMSEKIEVQYVDNVRTFLDPKKRFEEFLKMTPDDATAFNNRFSLGLTDEELRIASITASASEKFAAVFKLQTQPLQNGLDLDKLFGDNADKVRKWIENGERYGIRGIDFNRGNTILRVRRNTTGNATRVESASGYDVTVNAFRQAYEMARRGWDAGRTGRMGSIRHGSYATREIRVNDDNTVSVGCQTFTRAEVEKIASELGL